MSHTDLFRPGGAGAIPEILRWGCSETIASGPQYRARILSIRAGSRMPLRCYDSRHVRLIVLEGEIRLRQGNRIRTLNAHELADLPAGTMYRVNNAAARAARVMEISTGTFL